MVFNGRVDESLYLPYLIFKLCMKQTLLLSLLFISITAYNQNTNVKGLFRSNFQTIESVKKVKAYHTPMTINIGPNNLLITVTLIDNSESEILCVSTNWKQEANCVKSEMNGICIKGYPDRIVVTDSVNQIESVYYYIIPVSVEFNKN